MTKEQIYQLIQDSAANVLAHKSVRLGQSLSNTLFLHNRGLYESVMNSGVDPFYNDKKIVEFLKFLETKNDNH